MPVTALDIAAPLGKRVAVVTDNDKAETSVVQARYADYLEGGTISIHVGNPFLGSTLEPQLVASAGRDALSRILERDFDSDEALADHMTSDKTASALAIFEAEETVTMPQYIADAVA